MILIISEPDDISTSRTIDWLVYFGHKVLRIHPTHLIDVVDICIDNEQTDFSFSYNHSPIFKLSDVSAYWYRRGGLNFRWHQLLLSKLVSPIFAGQMKEDITGLEEYIHFILGQKKSIGDFYKGCFL